MTTAAGEFQRILARLTGVYLAKISEVAQAGPASDLDAHMAVPVDHLNRKPMLLENPRPPRTDRLSMPA